MSRQREGLWSSFFLTQDMLSGNTKMDGIYSSNYQIIVPSVVCFLFIVGIVFKVRTGITEKLTGVPAVLLLVFMFGFCILFTYILSAIFISADSKPDDETIAIFSIFITPILSFFSLDTYSKHLFPEDDQPAPQSVI